MTATEEDRIAPVTHPNRSRPGARPAAPLRSGMPSVLPSELPAALFSAVRLMASRLPVGPSAAKLLTFLVLTALVCPPLQAQERNPKIEYRSRILAGSSDLLPFWFHANRLGKVDPTGTNLTHELRVDHRLLEGERHSVSAGGSLLLRGSPRSTLHLPELFLSGTYGGFRLDIGRFPQPIGVNNHDLSVGSMMHSTNAVPVPKISLSNPRFVDIPLTRGFLQFKALFTHGWFPDNRFVEDVRLHQKFFYFRFNIENFSGTGGIVHQATWGGTHPQEGTLPQSFANYLRLISGMGATADSDAPPGEISNVIGNSLAAYEFHALYRFSRFRLSLTRLFYLEDKVSTRFRSPWDGSWGINWEWNEDNWLEGVTYEHINTKRQDSRWDQPSGRQNYYYNYIYQDGWTHEGRVLGIPLILYETDNHRTVNNIIIAHHVGAEGHLSPSLAWRSMATLTRNYGTFQLRQFGEGQFRSLEEMRRDNLSLLWEMSYDLPDAKGWTVDMAVGSDIGAYYRDSVGLMLGVRWNGTL